MMSILSRMAIRPAPGAGAAPARMVHCSNRMGNAGSTNTIGRMSHCSGWPSRSAASRPVQPASCFHHNKALAVAMVATLAGKVAMKNWLGDAA